MDCGETIVDFNVKATNGLFCCIFGFHFFCREHSVAFSAAAAAAAAAMASVIVVVVVVVVVVVGV